MLGGHELSELDLKERLRLLMNKVQFFLLSEFFPFNLVSFSSFRLYLGGITMIV